MNNLQEFNELNAIIEKMETINSMKDKPNLDLENAVKIIKDQEVVNDNEMANISRKEYIELLDENRFLKATISFYADRLPRQVN